MCVLYVFVSELGKAEINKTYDRFLMSVYEAHFAISVDNFNVVLTVHRR